MHYINNYSYTSLLVMETR